MNIDKKITMIFSVSLLFMLSFSLCFSFEFITALVSGLLLIYVFLLCYFVKKQKILDINKKQIILIVLVVSLVQVMVYYLFGIEYGYFRSPYIFSFKNVIRFLLPNIISIVSFEIIRKILLSQENKFADITSYIGGVLLEVILVTEVITFSNYDNIIDILGIYLLPAIISNVLYTYISKNYGAMPNIIYKMITTLYIFIIPVIPNLADSFMAVFKLLIPLLVLIMIKLLFEKKKKYALERKGFLGYIITSVSLVFALIVTMIFSCQFSVGAIVIATDSMTGEINKGDIIIYKEYSDDSLEVGQVILFTQGESIIVHRIINIEEINGEMRYYTKGDANSDWDMGYRLEKDIVATTDIKVPYVGYLTLWLRELFT